MKNTYKSPLLQVVQVRTPVIVLLSGVREGNNGQSTIIITNGGTTSSAGITEGDANKRDIEWGNLW